MPQTKSSTKPINNNLLIGFTNDNFGVFCSNYFLNYFPLANFKTNLSSAQNASPVFKNFKNSPSSAQITSPVFKNFKNNPSSALNASSLFSSKQPSLFLEAKNPFQNASSLFCAPLTLHLKTTCDCLCVASLRLLLKAFWLKSAVKADFLTPEPKNVNIMAASDTYLRDEQSSKKGLTIAKTSINIKQDLVNVKSDLTAANNINILSGADTNLIGGNLSSGRDITINASGELNSYAVADQHYTYQNNTKTRSFATIAKYTGVSLALDSVNKILDVAGDMSSLGQNKDTRNANAGASAANNNGKNDSGAALSIAKGTLGYYQNLAEGDFNSKSSTKTTNDTIYQKNILTSGNNSGNNLNLAANNDVNLVGTDLSATNGNITSINGNVNIANVKDSHKEESQTNKSKTTFTSIVAGTVKNTFLVASTAVTYSNQLKNPNDKTATYNENEAAMKDTAKKSEINIRHC